MNHNHKKLSNILPFTSSRKGWLNIIQNNKEHGVFLWHVYMQSVTTLVCGHEIDLYLIDSHPKNLPIALFAPFRLVRMN